MSQTLGRLGSGEVVVDRPRSHLHADVARLLPEALGRVMSAGREFLIAEVDFGRLVGQTICVATRPGDQIVFAQRVGRAGLTRFVKNRKSEPCSSVVVVLKAGDGGEYVCMTAFVGHRAEPEPWDDVATEQSVPFWSSRALIWGSEPIVLGTETTRCPW